MIQFTYSIDWPDTRITFPDKPSEAIRAMLKGAGFRWSPAGGCWWRRGCKGAADFITALDRRMNPDRPDGACWRCQSPQGFFRAEGTATPVWCDTCHAAIRAERERVERERQQADRSDMDYEDSCRNACGL